MTSSISKKLLNAISDLLQLSINLNHQQLMKGRSFLLFVLKMV
jgi:hypothetical protein